MKPTNILMHWGAQLVIEWPVRKLSLSELMAQLEQSAKQISENLGTCSDTINNCHLLGHVIGIERWGQRKLRVALGEPFLVEEYDHYRPSTDSSWDDLKAEWITTRQVTITLAGSLVQANVPSDSKIIHNQYGPLSIKGWLRYLDVHSTGEVKKFK
jgi:hypothetical protein